MRYDTIQAATFKRRENRFIAYVDIDGREHKVHVPNTGRCRELLIPGVQVILAVTAKPSRKTAYSLIAVYKGDLLINIDSQIPNKVVYEAIQQGAVTELGCPATLKKEVVYGTSRFDLAFADKEKQGYIEIKGVTLEREGVALFPDAPTERGTRHVEELIAAVQAGYQGYMFFLIQLAGARYFTPNGETDPAFAKALRLAAEAGVTLLAYDAVVTADSIVIGKKLPILL